MGYISLLIKVYIVYGVDNLNTGKKKKPDTINIYLLLLCSNIIVLFWNVSKSILGMIL